MNFIAILIALGLEQWRAFRWRKGVQQLFGRYARFLEHRFNAGTEQQGALTALLAMGPPVAIAAAGYWALDALHPLLGFVWNVAILYLLVGFRQFSHAFTAIGDALRAGDAIGARKRLVAWRGADASAVAAEEIPKLAIEQGIVDSYRHVFGTLFWFLVLPGPGGAVLYRLTVLLAGQWQGVAATPTGHPLASFGRPVQRLLYWLDWIPVRLTALTFAIVGDFEDAVYCWRVQAKQWPSIHDGILLASGAGALGVQIGGVMTDSNGEPEFRPELGMGEPGDADILPSAIGLVWRALLVWLAVLLLLTVAYWAP
ncbi:MAG TPA: CobD/CbiB family protein [Casimicrobiaceae bacterium]|jgi:adenosylcobinamide-phosphate synthase|nr:CobD/CbiB family protein [Casimicrobiaceae bacterium]